MGGRENGKPLDKTNHPAEALIEYELNSFGGESFLKEGTNWTD